ESPAGAPTARQLLESSAAALKSIADVNFQQVTKVGGMDAMSLKISGPGTGAAIAPNGPIRTCQHWIAFPKGNRVLVLLLTAPDAKKAEYGPLFEAMVASVTIDDKLK